MSAAQHTGDWQAPPSFTLRSPAETDTVVFESIYRQYSSFVESAARRLGVAPTALDDVVQEVFIIVHSRLHTLREPHALRSWIYGIVRRTVSGHHRSSRAKEIAGARLSEAPLLGPRLQTPLDIAEQNDQVRLLWSLLDELDPYKREVFVMVELNELTVPEVAESLEIPQNTAYSRLRAARQAFEEAMARRGRRSRGLNRQRTDAETPPLPKPQNVVLDSSFQQSSI